MKEVDLAKLGHDLRNALNSIRLGCEIMRQQAKDEAALKRVARMLASVDKMARLIDASLTEPEPDEGPITEPDRALDPDLDSET